MRKILSLFVAAIMLLTAGCSQTADQPVNSGEDPIVLPPKRIGEGVSHVSLDKRYTFETAFSEADVVARIKVGNWLSEDLELDSTFFEANVLQCFKGDISETFILKQSGSSYCTIKDYPLFTYGNELLLFLSKGSSSDYEEGWHAPEYDTFYWIIGSFSTLLDVSYDSRGSRYYADRYGILTEFLDASSNYANQNDVSSKVFEDAVSSDPLIADISHYPYIFSEADFIDLIDSSKIF